MEDRFLDSNFFYESNSKRAHKNTPEKRGTYEFLDLVNDYIEGKSISYRIANQIHDLHHILPKSERHTRKKKNNNLQG